MSYLPVKHRTADNLKPNPFATDGQATTLPFIDEVSKPAAVQATSVDTHPVRTSMIKNAAAKIEEARQRVEAQKQAFREHAAKYGITI